MNRRAKYQSKYNSFVVCALAYAITIQAALLGYVASSMAGSGGIGISTALLCAGRDRGDTPVAPAHSPDMLCCVAAGCSGSAGVPAERASIEPPAVVVTSGVAGTIPATEFVEWPSERPKSSRAPPV